MATRKDRHSRIRSRLGVGSAVALVVLLQASAGGCRWMERAGGSFVPMTYDEPCDGHSDCGHCHVCVRSLRMARGTCHLSCALSGRCPDGMQCDTITERIENDGVDDPVRTMEVCRWRSTTVSLRAASR